MKKGDVFRHPPAVAADPGEDGAVVSQDHVRFFLFHPVQHAGFIELVADVGRDFGKVGVGGLPGEQAGEPEVFHLGIDELGHGHAHPAMAAETGLLQSLEDGVKLVVGHVVHGHLVERVTQGDHGKRVPPKPKFEPEGGQGAEDDPADAAIDEDPGEFLARIFVVAQPVDLDTVAQFCRPVLDSGPVTREGEILFPSFPGGEGGEEGEITDKFRFSGGTEVGHQGADHGMGGVAEILGRLFHPLAHHLGDSGIVAEGEGDGDFGDPAPLGNILQGDFHRGKSEQALVAKAS